MKNTRKVTGSIEGYDSRLISEESRAVYRLLTEEIDLAKPDDLSYLELQAVPLTLRIVNLLLPVSYGDQ